MNIDEVMTFSHLHICEHMGQNSGIFLEFLAAAIAKELRMLRYVYAKWF
jgi:hypothetical protein